MDGHLNIWSAVFLLGAFHGVFLWIVMLRSNGNNRLSKVLFATLSGALIVANLDYFLLSSSLYNVWPAAFGVSNGLIFLFGPLLYLYARSLLDRHYAFRWMDGLHFIPYVLGFLMNLELLSLPDEQKLLFIEEFIAGRVTLSAELIGLFIVQALHFTIYAVLGYRLTSAAKAGDGSEYLVSVTDRLGWLRWLQGMLLAYGVIVLALMVFSIAMNSIQPIPNYIYTLSLSIITFVVGYRLVLDHRIVFPGFVRKYSTGGFDMAKASGIKEQLEQLMTEEKPYLDSGLTVQSLADRMEIPRNQLSHAINSLYSKNFSEFVNTYRVEEFIRKFREQESPELNIYGLSLESGFNSKSTFNSAFKKHTGQTPTQYLGSKSGKRSTEL